MISKITQQVKFFHIHCCAGVKKLPAKPSAHYASQSSPVSQELYELGLSKSEPCSVVYASFQIIFTDITICITVPI